MRTVCGLVLVGLIVVAGMAGCGPAKLSPEKLESAAVGTWRDQKKFPLELRADKTLTTPIDSQDRTGTWSLKPATREIVMEIAEGEPRNGRTYPPTTWTGYLSEDGRSLKLYNLAPDNIENAKKLSGKDPGAMLRKD